MTTVKRMATGFGLMLISSATGFAQSHPVLTTPTSPGGVHSRNTELVDLIPVRPTSGDQFALTEVEYEKQGGGTGKKMLLVSSSAIPAEDGSTYSGVLIFDVTDPRSPAHGATPYLRISIMGGETEPVFGNLGVSQAYKLGCTPSSTTFNGDVMLLTWVGDPYKAKAGGLWLEDDVMPDSSSNPNDPDYYNAKARFVVINLTNAVELRESGSSNLIVIHNPTVRNVTYNATIINNANIYLGYVPSDFKWFKKIGFDWELQVYSAEAYDRSPQEGPHSLNADQQAGFMTITPYRRVNIRANSGEQPCRVLRIPGIRVMSSHAGYYGSPASVC